MASENQEMNYEMLEENVAENQEATNSDLNQMLKKNFNCVLSRKEEGECSTTVLPDPFLEGCHELREIIAFNMLAYWKNDITWLCSITKDQNIWTFEISLWEIWCSSYDFQDYLKMMYLYFWALQFRRIQVKLVIIIETAVYRKYYFNRNYWYTTTDEVEESEKQFARKLFSGISMIEIREDPEEVFGTRFADNNLEQDPEEVFETQFADNNLEQDPEEVFGTQFADSNLERGKLLINSCEVYVLLDIDSTHYFISPAYAQRLNITSENLDFDLSIVSHYPLTLFL